MAQQAVRKQVPAVETAAPRRRAPRLPVVKTGTEAPNYERWRLTINNPDEFMAFMRGYPNPQGVTLFLYRLKPKIDLTLIGQEETNLQKGGYDDLSLFSVEAVAEKFGRGQYNVRVTDSNRPDGQRQVIQTCLYKLSDVDKPPVYDVRTLLLGHNDNIDEVNRLLATGVLVRDGPGATPRLRTASDAPAVAGAPVYAPLAAPADRSATDLLYQIAVEAFKSSRQSPTEHVRDSIEIAKLMRPETPALSVDQIVEAVVTRLGGAPRGVAADPFAQWEKVQSFIERAGGIVAERAGVVNPAAGAGAPAGESWAPHVAGIISEVRAFWPEVLHGLRMLRAEKGAPAETQNGGGLQLLPLNQRIEAIIKTGFETMRRGITGEQFAAWLCISGEFPGGLEAFNYLKPGGAAGLITMAGMDPRGAAIVNDATVRPQLDLFLASFFSFDPAAAAAAS